MCNQIETLMKFYQVETLEDLVREQAEQIVRLQLEVTRLQISPFNYRSVREG